MRVIEKVTLGKRGDGTLIRVEGQRFHQHRLLQFGSLLDDLVSDYRGA